MNNKKPISREEAIEAIKCNYPPPHYSMLREALDIAIEDMQKQIPKKPVLISDGSLNGYRSYRCPKCGARVHIQSYCMHCGQAIKGGSGMEADSIIIDEVAHDKENDD